MKKTFVLCVGSSKSGTSWLHQYLSAAPGVYGGPIKEYHVWDALTVPECERYKVSLDKTLYSDTDRLVWMMQNIRGYYFHYFDALLHMPGITTTMDITPLYCSLTADTLRDIRDEFRDLDVDLKAVFLMREPVDRCWSHIRMLYRHAGNNNQPVSSADLLDHARSWECQVRSHYDLIIPKLESVFEPEKLHFGFYESMFEPTEVDRLSRFLGVPTDTSYAQQRIHVGQSVGSVAPADRLEIERMYAATYTYVYERFPHVQRLWVQS